MSTLLAVLRFVYGLVDWILPAGVREYLKSPYISYHRRRSWESRRLALPYWEREVAGPSPNGEVRVGFVGAGTYARHHLEVLTSLPGVRIASILTTGGPLVAEVAQKYGIHDVFTDLKKFSSQTDVDCFVVVVSAPMINSVATSVLNTGRPVLMEKPAGFSSRDTADLASEAELAGTFGVVGLNRRFYSVLEHGLAALADCGPIRGAVVEDHIAITKDRNSGRLTESEYDGMMFRNGVHGIDLLRYVLGDVRTVHSAAIPNAEFGYASASFSSILEHESGALSTYAAFWDTSPVTRIRIIAEQGSVQLDPLEKGWFTNAEGLRIPLRIDPVDEKFRMGLYAQDRLFIDSVRQRKRPQLPACLLPDAVETNRLIEKILSNNLTATGAIIEPVQAAAG